MVLVLLFILVKIFFVSRVRDFLYYLLQLWSFVALIKQVLQLSHFIAALRKQVIFFSLTNARVFMGGEMYIKHQNFPCLFLSSMGKHISIREEKKLFY